MVNRNITYENLEKILSEQGFQIRGRRGTNNVFSHSALGSIVVLPSDSQQKVANPVHTVSVKHALVENGLMSKDDFERSLTLGVRGRRAGLTNRRVAVKKRSVIRAKERA